MGKPLKRILERAHQYRVIAERLQFHLDRENLPKEAADLVRIAQAALAEAAEAEAAEVVEESAEVP
jgi:phage shock protein A